MLHCFIEIKQNVSIKLSMQASGWDERNLWECNYTKTLPYNTFAGQCQDGDWGCFVTAASKLFTST